MGKMLDGFRAFWNDLGDVFASPERMDRLNIADIEKALAKAKHAAASFIGRPVRLQSEVVELEKEEIELTEKAKLLKSRQELDAARKLVGRLAGVKKDLEIKRAEYEDARQAADAWKTRIRSLEDELEKRRRETADRQNRMDIAKSTEAIGKSIDAVDKRVKSGVAGKFEAQVRAAEDKAEGYMALSGLDEEAELAKKLKDAEIDALLDSL
ncbi:MAG: PspA/IM30 family protein [Turicibacter sp.]|nr:PspA/IM30 family protein [Turicibacter sp.]